MAHLSMFVWRVLVKPTPLGSQVFETRRSSADSIADEKLTQNRVFSAKFTTRVGTWNIRTLSKLFSFHRSLGKWLCTILTLLELSKCAGQDTVNFPTYSNQALGLQYRTTVFQRPGFRGVSASPGLFITIGSPRTPHSMSWNSSERRCNISP